MFDVLKQFRKFYDPWAAPKPSHSRPRRTVHLEGPQLLEARDAPAVDIWQPAGVNLLASNAANWSNGLPGGQDVEFDGSKSNEGITWDQSFSPASITLQNKYTGQMTLNTGVVLAVAGSINGEATSTLNVDFKAPSCTLAIQGGTSTLTNFNLSDQNGLLEIQGGTLNVAGTSSQSYVTIEVYDGTTLNITAGANLWLKSGAKLDVYQGGTLGLDGSRGGTLLQNDGTAGSILNNAGTINFTGTAGGLSADLNLPVLNSGVFNINGGGNALQAGSELDIRGQDALTQNSDLLMTGGSVNLSGATRLVVVHGYTQTGGTFQTTDSLPEQFFVGAGGLGNATVSGGNIKLGTATTYGELDVYCAAFNMSGEYDPKVNGQMTGQCDQLIFQTGFMNIQTGSTINVTVLGNLAAGQWAVIHGSSKPLNDFTNKTLNGLTVNVPQLQNGIYELDNS